MSPAEIRDRLIAARVVPVLRLESAALTERAILCLLDVGFTAIEVTMSVPGAVKVIEKFSSRALVGAGTVLDETSAHDCLAAGAQFLVSPLFFPELVRIAHAAAKPAMLGGFTPTEVLAAHRSHADIVKVFPASSGGPAHLAALRSVYPQIKLCPTGGITAANMQQYFDAGADLVGVGNAIVPLAALKSGDLDAVRSHAAAYLGKSLA